MPECAEGWIQCTEENPCSRHAEFWRQYMSQEPQIPESPENLGEAVK